MKFVIFVVIGLALAVPLSEDLAQLSLLQTPKEEVLEQLGDLLSELRKEQTMDDTQLAQTNAKLEADILISQSQLEAQVNQLKATNTLIGDLSEEIYSISKTWANLNQQLTDLGARDIQLRDSLANEGAAFENESSQARRSINGLTQIISKLTDAVLSQQSLIEKQEIVNVMKQELGQKHPVALLVEVTSKFDKATVQNIILKLEHIQSQQEQQLIQSEQNWTVQQQTYQTLLNEISEVSKKLSFDASTAKTSIAKKQNEKVTAEKRKAQLETTIPQTEQVLTNLKQQQEAYNVAYSARKQKRTQEVETLKSAFELLEKKLR
ncbi:unnamed protein product [Paramecium primaurelia]|uniref:Uncharacterized protein n=1 Tax=Paramecium primaurelia TaxID=5886 RepID=A0A8S1MBD9_PARPR|nr:unnamed protein product [Paramecium primaurelia]